MNGALLRTRSHEAAPGAACPLTLRQRAARPLFGPFYALVLLVKPTACQGFRPEGARKLTQSEARPAGPWGGRCLFSSHAQ